MDRQALRVGDEERSERGHWDIETVLLSIYNILFLCISPLNCISPLVGDHSKATTVAHGFVRRKWMATEPKQASDYVF